VCVCVCVCEARRPLRHLDSASVERGGASDVKQALPPLAYTHTFSLSHTHTFSLCHAHTNSLSRTPTLSHTLSLAHTLSHPHTLTHSLFHLDSASVERGGASDVKQALAILRCLFGGGSPATTTPHFLTVLYAFLDCLIRIS